MSWGQILDSTKPLISVINMFVCEPAKENPLGHSPSLLRSHYHFPPQITCPPTHSLVLPGSTPLSPINLSVQSNWSDWFFSCVLVFVKSWPGHWPGHRPRHRHRHRPGSEPALLPVSELSENPWNDPVSPQTSALLSPPGSLATGHGNEHQKKRKTRPSASTNRDVII